MYRRFSDPPKKQPLHLLYPGRILLPGEGFTSEGIPNEDPQGAALTRNINRELNETAEWESNQYSRILGGHPKTYPEFVDEPEQFVDDSRTVQIQSVSPPSDHSNIPSPLDKEGIKDIVKETLNNIRAEESEMKRYSDPPFTLPKNWKVEGFQYPSTSSNNTKWIYGIIILAIIVMIIGIYMMKK